MAAAKATEWYREEWEEYLGSLKIRELERSGFQGDVYGLVRDLYNGGQ